MDNVKIAVVGVGFFGEKHARVYCENPLSELTAIVDVDEERAESVAKKYGAKSWYTNIHEMLDEENVDAVSIATPEFSHKEPAVAAIKAGKHTFVEKPIAHTIEDAIAIADSAKKYKVKLMIGYILHFDPRYVEAKRSIDRGDIGELLSIWARRAASVTVPEKVADWTTPLFYMAVHDIDLMNWYVGKKAERVYAEATSKIFTEKGVPDVILALIKYQNGVIASLEVNWCRPAIWQYPLESRMHVSGSKGIIYVDIYDQGLNIFSEKGHTCPDMIHWPETNNYIDGDLKQELNHFLECIILDEEPLVTSQDGIDSLNIALAIKESFEKGKIMKL